MGALTKIQLLLKHMQFIGLLQSIDIPFPKIYFDFSSLSNLISLDPAFLQSLDQNFPVFTFRLQFFFIAVALPLIIMMLTLLVFVNLTTIMWMCFSVTGIVLVVLRIGAQIEPSFVNSGDVASKEYLTVMLCTLGYCAAYRLAGKFLARERSIVVLTKNVLSAVMLFAGGCMVNLDTLGVQLMLTASCANLLCYVYKADRSKGVKFLLFLIIAGVCAAAWAKMEVSFKGVFPDMLVIPGYMLVALGAVGWLQFLMYSNSDKGVGRAFIAARKKMQNLLDKSLLAVSFFFLSSSFVPVVTTCLQMFVCDTYNCPTGTKFNPYRPVDYTVVENTTQRDQYCDPCIFQNGCPYTSSQLCPEFRDSRLFFHPDTSCNDRVAGFYKAAAVFVLIVFVVVVCVMYYMIIETITVELRAFTGHTYQNLRRQYLVLHQRFLHNAKKAKEENRRDETARVHDAMLQQNVLSSPANPMDDLTWSSEPHNREAGGSSVPAAQTAGSLNFVKEAFDPLDISDSDMASPRSDHTACDIQTPMLSPPTCPPPARKRRQSSFFNKLRATLRPGQISLHVEELKAKFVEFSKEQEPTTAPEPPTMNDALLKVNAKIEPKASSLYNAYRREHQYFLLLEIYHRLALVVVSVFISPKFGFAAPLNLGVHAVYLLIVMVVGPYVGKLEQSLAIAVGVSDTISAGYATLLWSMPDNESVTSEALGVFALLIGVVPIICGVVWQVADMRRSLVNPYAKEEELERTALEEQTNKRIAELQDQVENADLYGLREKTVATYEAEIKKLKAPVETPEMKLTDALNASTKKTILRFFVIGSIPPLLIALGLCVYATLNDPGQEFLNGSDLIQRTQALVLADRSSWDEFTNDCCCFVSLEPSKGYNITERWACAQQLNATITSTAMVTAGATVSRNRQSQVKMLDTGLPIRGVCKRTFTLANCSVRVDGGVVSLDCPEAALDATNVSLYARRVLW